MTSALRGTVIGSPVEHSLSPLLHREAYAFLGIEGNYQRNEVLLGTLGQFFNENQDSFDYLSITMPLKEEALTLACIEGRGSLEHLEAYVHLEILK